MNFLQAAITSFTGPSIPYSQTETQENCHIWTHTFGLSKDNQLVSIFAISHPTRFTPDDNLRFSRLGLSGSQAWDLAQNAVKWHKMFGQLPGVLKLIEVIDKEGLWIITERCSKNTTLQSKSKEEKEWGIYQILTALKFLEERKVSINFPANGDSCIFINSLGEWKLSGFQFAHQGIDTKSISEFIGKNIKSVSSHMETFGSGNALIKCYCKMNELMVLDSTQKLEVFKSVSICNFPIRYSVNKGLQEMSYFFDQSLQNPQGQTLSQLIYMMYLILQRCIFTNDENLDDEVSNKAVTLFKQVYFKSFPLADRSVRLVLVKILPQILSSTSNLTIQVLTDYEIQDKVYPQLTTGLSDTEPLLRHATLSTIPNIIPHITDRQLNNDLLRHLAKLQTDKNPQMRRAVIDNLVLMGAKMHANTRTGVLITALGKGMRDSDYDVRLAAVKAIAKSVNEEWLAVDKDTCGKVLGTAGIGLMDESAIIRGLSKKIIDNYIKAAQDKYGSGDSDFDIDENANDAWGDEIDIQLDGVGLEEMGNGLLSSIGDLSEVFTTHKTYDTAANSTSNIRGMNNSNSNNSNNNKLGSFAVRGSLSNKFDNLKIDDTEDYKDDGWGFDDEEIKPVTLKKPTRSSAPKINRSSLNATAKRPGLSLGKKSTASKIIKAEIDDDGWGDGW